MISISDERFSTFVSESIDSLPEKFGREIKNVAFVVEDEPNLDQRAKLQLTKHQSLFGLYEGIPLTHRGTNYTFVLPDKITIFKQVIAQHSQSEEQVAALVKRTVWHEVAHHFGLDHGRIEELERRDTA